MAYVSLLAKLVPSKVEIGLLLRQHMDYVTYSGASVWGYCVSFFYYLQGCFIRLILGQLCYIIWNVTKRHAQKMSIVEMHMFHWRFRDVR